MDDNCLINISSKKIFNWLSVITLVVIFFHLTRNFYGFPDIGITAILDMDTERSIPTWYSVVLLFIAFGISFVIAYIEKTAKKRNSNKWFFVSLMLLLMSLDESAMIHELIGPVVSKMTGITSGYLSWGWYIPALFIIFFVIIYLFRFWLSLPKRVRLLIAFSLITFIAGAVGIEMLSANYITNYTVGLDPYNTTTYIVMVALEEGMEMMGSIIFIYALLLYLKECCSKVKLNFDC